MRLEVLGPLRLLSGERGETEIPVPRGRVSGLLAVLAGGAELPAPRLIDLLWESPPPSADKSLRASVSALRTVLERAGDAGRLRVTPGGYRLQLEPAECDLLEFEQLASTSPRRALALWRGDPDWPGVRSSPAGLLDETIRRWERARVACETAESVPRQLPADTADFTGRGPIVEEIGEMLTAPGPVPVVTITGQPGTGKTALAVHLGHRVAERFPDGQLHVSLGGGSGCPRPPEQALADLLRALGVVDAAIPPGLDQRAAAFRSKLAGRRVLVVLDDAADSAQVRPLLPGAEGSAALVTSRTLLTGLSGAHGFALSPFTHAEATSVLVKVLGAARVNAEPEAAAELVDLCGRLPLAIRVVAARLATRPRWSLTSLLARMRDQRSVFDELKVAELDVRAGFAVSHDALGPLEQLVFRRFALVDARELSPWALAALAGDAPGFDEALHYLLASHLVEPATGEPERYTMHDLVRLFAAEQAVAADGDVAEPGTLARDAFFAVFTRARGLIERAYKELPPPAGWLRPLGPPSGATASALPRLDPGDWCAAECETLLAVLTRAAALGWHREALDAAERFASFLAVKHRSGEVVRLFGSLAAACAGDPLAEARARFGLAHGAAMTGRLRDAAAILSDCATVFAGHGAQHALSNTLVLLSFCRLQLDDYGPAEELARQALEIAHDPRGEARALRQLALVVSRRGALAEVVGYLDRALVLARQVGEADLEGIVRSSLARTLVDLGELDQADEMCRQAIKLLDELDQPVGRAYVRIIHSRVAELRGHSREAADLVENELKVFKEYSDRRGEIEASHRLAVNRLALGEHTEAVALIRIALGLCEELGMIGKARELAALLLATTR